MATADAATPAPTYGDVRGLERPCTVPSSPFGPCSTGKTASTGRARPPSSDAEQGRAVRRRHHRHRRAVDAPAALARDQHRHHLVALRVEGGDHRLRGRQRHLVLAAAAPHQDRQAAAGHAASRRGAAGAPPLPAPRRRPPRPRRGRRGRLRRAAADADRDRAARVTGCPRAGRTTTTVPAGSPEATSRVTTSKPAFWSLVWASVAVLPMIVRHGHLLRRRGHDQVDRRALRHPRGRAGVLADHRALGEALVLGSSVTLPTSRPAPFRVGLGAVRGCGCGRPGRSRPRARSTRRWSRCCRRRPATRRSGSGG